MDNSEQIEYWNGEAGRKWVAYADLLDAMLEPFADMVVSAARLQSGERVMDIGCGGGALTLKAAREVGPAKGALGVDISEPLLALARDRAASASLPATFECADASSYRAAEPIDAVISRFGVMFFEDPAQAFGAIRGNLRGDGRIVFMCWQSLAENDWARAPLEAALPFLSEMPESPAPGTPGPFAFADKDHIARFMAEAGWRDVEIAPWAGKMQLPGESAQFSTDFMMKLGPVARLVEAQGVDLAPIQAALQTRLEGMLGADGRVWMQAACWMVSAKA